MLNNQYLCCFQSIYYILFYVRKISKPLNIHTLTKVMLNYQLDLFVLRQMTAQYLIINFAKITNHCLCNLLKKYIY